MITVYRVTFDGGWREFLTQQEAKAFKASEPPNAETTTFQKPSEREPYIHATTPDSD